MVWHQVNFQRRKNETAYSIRRYKLKFERCTLKFTESVGIGEHPQHLDEVDKLMKNCTAEEK